MLRFRRARALFLQFKLAEVMTHRLGGQWDKFGAPYFRFWLMARRKSQQHRLLLRLGKAGRVYYAAPTFLSSEDLNEAFRTGTVTSRSALFSPAAIGALPDDASHCVAYRPNESFGWFCSDPLQIRRSSVHDPRALLLEAAADRSLPVLTPDATQRVVDELLRDAFAREAPTLIEYGLPDTRSAFELLGYVAHVFYSSQLVLVRAEEG
jgi:hypothetical protein